MAIFVDENTKVVYQGLTGSQGRFYGLLNREYGTQVVAGTNPKKAGTDVEGIPIFASVAEAVKETGGPIRLTLKYPTGDAAAPDTNDHHTLCMTFEEMHACVATAHNHKLKVTGHCRATEGIKNALRAGYDTLEHATFNDDEGLDMLLARNTPVVPALQFEWASVERGPEFDHPQKVIDAHQETLEGGAESARRILKAGGRLGMGGDYGFAWNPHGDYAKELTFFVKHVGFTPIEVIRCATKTGAETNLLNVQTQAAQAALTPKLQELREIEGWQRWANVGIQEQLCEKMEALKSEVLTSGYVLCAARCDASTGLRSEPARSGARSPRCGLIERNPGRCGSNRCR